MNEDQRKAQMEAELDATVAAVERTLRESERLAGIAQEGRQAFAEWMSANGIPPTATEIFVSQLSSEAQKQYQDEKERLAMEDRHDQEAALQRAKMAVQTAAGNTTPPKPKRRRDLV